MNATHVKSEDVDRMSSADQHQIDTGTYQIRQGDRVAAFVCVFPEEDGSTVLVEHWALIKDVYQPPNPDKTVPALYFKAHTVNAKTEEAFIDELRRLAGEKGYSYRYIKARCVASDL